MADVQMIFGFLLLMGIAFPGMLTAWWLLFPNIVSRAQRRVAHTPWRTFGLGLAGTAALAVPVGLLFSLSFGPARFAGFACTFAVLGFASLGAAGIAAEIGQRLKPLSGKDSSDAGLYVRGAVAFELAAVFPVIGWFIVIPLGVITSIGAAIFGLLNWMPRPGFSPDNQQPLEAAAKPPPN